jgi:hypothetical protein
MASGIENLAEFQVAIKREGEELIPAQVAMLRDRFTLGLHRRITLAMPVDTGYARASTNASIGTPDERTPTPGLDNYSPPDPPVSLGGTPQNAFEPGYVTNAAGYVPFLNEGSSQQAPAHFVQRAIEEEIQEAGV